MEAETLITLHQLQVLQLELKAQNEELQQLRDLAELESAKYHELFHSSPTGYFTLSRDGSILDINMSGADILGKDQTKFKNNKFGFFVSVDSRAIFNSFIKRIFISHEKETCEVTLIIHGKIPIVVSLSGIAKSKGEYCFITLINLSDLEYVSQLSVANQELLFQNDEKAKHATELITVNKELLYQKVIGSLETPTSKQITLQNCNA